MYRLGIKAHFDAAHSLNGYHGDCANLHGHRWEVEVFLTFTELDESGMAIDFKKVKATLEKLLPDHKYLNNLYDFNPTAENIAYHLFRELKDRYTALEKVRVWETPECYAEYDENDPTQL